MAALTSPNVAIKACRFASRFTNPIATSCSISEEYLRKRERHEGKEREGIEEGREKGGKEEIMEDRSKETKMSKERRKRERKEGRKDE